MRPKSESEILDLVQFILPEGTTKSGDWNRVCDWPPDLFAVVATITEWSGLYSEASFMAYWSNGFLIDQEWIDGARGLGEQWARTGKPPSQVATMWSTLIKTHGHAAIHDSSPESTAWKKITFTLLAIADEACAGIGFMPAAPGHVVSPIQYLVYVEYANLEASRLGLPALGDGSTILPYLPYSLCLRVPPAIACVQPKASTPPVGCTLRSLTHHVALLPSVANVTTHWQPADAWEREPSEPEAFNLLILPFPYHIPGKGFVKVPGGFPGGSKERAFTLDPSAWLRETTEEQFADFILDLIGEAQPELTPVHAVVMPETALSIEFSNKVAEILARKNSSLDLFITGVVSINGCERRNLAAIYRFFSGEVARTSFQSKHHRWLLNGEQVRRYHLGHILDPGSKWWEQIDVGYRHCYVTSFRPQASLSVLVCEDLARYDPVLTVMNAIGPNLVVALLMDGPQLEQRWPGRYATVLAEDPGSAVLTVTSLGMVLRSSYPGDKERREIALWKQPNGQARALKLPKGAHALLLALTSRWVEQFTLDGRTDSCSTLQFELSAARPVYYPRTMPAGLEFRG